MSNLLSLESVSVAYGHNIVLNDISLRVNERDYIGVIGPNGGGKTTLLKLILGVIRPLNGKRVLNGSLLDEKKIGYLPQISTGDTSYPINVSEVVLSRLMVKKRLFSGITSADRNKAAEVIENLGLRPLACAALNELSGGELQRVFLGRAIIGDPKLLLLDEPGNFVDASFESNFYEKLRELNEKMAILMVSHDIGMISGYVKSYACVNRHLHYHPSSEISNEQLMSYGCPIQLITHGEVPHTVLKLHD